MREKSEHEYNGAYTGRCTDHVAFPMGGMGAGMVCLDGTGSLSHLSVRNRPDIFNEPYAYSAVCVKGKRGNRARVLEGQVPRRKVFGYPDTGKGGDGKNLRAAAMFPCFFPGPISVRPRIAR